MYPCIGGGQRASFASMNFNWLKSILPKGLYGRAALILVLPVITIQLVVSVVFIQRLFDGVTQQMTNSIATELVFFLREVNAAGDRQAGMRIAQQVGTPLGFVVRPLSPSQMKTGEKRTFDDLTGKVVIATLRQAVPAVRLIDLESRHQKVLLQLQTRIGGVEILFDRLRVSASNPHQLLVFMIVVSVFMTLIAFIFLKNQVRPIRRLARAAEAFGKGRRVYYHVSGATEVRQAGRAFLDMRDRIERQIEQRTLMLSGVSHDLRTPLTRLKLGLSMVGDDPEIAALIRDVDDMEQMLDEFLAFARGDSLEATSLVDPRDIAQQVVADSARMQGQVLLEPTRGAPGATLVVMRPNSVRRALENLVTNALRYGSRCRVAVQINPRDIVFVVQDDGPGIPPDQRDKALRPFERLDVARNQNQGLGVGLGLAIAMDIASNHGGSLALSESAEMGGLKVELVLPR